MLYVLRKPQLQSLSQGSRLAFVRKFRGLTQHQLGIAAGMSDDRVRNRICRYEKGGRTPKPDRIEKFAEILNVNVEMIKVYDFINPTDLIYELFWIEELLSDSGLRIIKCKIPENPTADVFASVYPIWNKMRKRYQTKEISDIEYLEWKLTYKV